ncbi:PAS domain S-box protein [Elusimicrobiota bacterium]
MGERRAAEGREDLGEKDGMLRVISEEAWCGIILIDSEESIIYSNEAAARVLGYEDDGLRGAQAADLLADSLSRSSRAMLSDMFKGEAGRCETEFKRKDGAAVEVEVSCRSIRRGDEPVCCTVFRDISDKKRLESAVDRQTELLRSTFESLADAVFILDTRKPPVIMDCNPSAEGMFGYRREDMVGRSAVFLHMDEESLHEFQVELYRGMQGGRRLCRVPLCRMRRDDGMIFETEQQVSQLMDKDGVRIGWVSVVRDITERRRAERALRESEEKFRNVTEHSPNLVFINQGGRIVYVNRSCARAMGYKRKEFYAPEFDFLVMVSPDSREAAIENMRRHGRGEEIEPHECGFVSKRGREIHAICSLTRINYEGEPALLGILTDVTERKRSENALRESEQRYRELFDNMNSGVAVYEAVGNGRDFVFKDFNRAGERIDKVRRKNLIGKSVRKVFPGVVKFGLFKAFQEVWRTGKPRHYPVAFYKDKRVQGWRDNYVYKLPTGEVVAIYEDVSERIRIEESLRGSKKPRQGKTAKARR